MNIVIKGVNLKLTPSLHIYVNEKIGLLGKLLPDSVEVVGSPFRENHEVKVELIRTTRHHRHGAIFRAEVNLILKGGLKVFRATATSNDIRVAVDEAKNEIEQQFKKFKGKEYSRYLRGARVAKKFLKLSKLARWFRRGRIREEGL